MLSLGCLGKKQCFFKLTGRRISSFVYCRCLNFNVSYDGNIRTFIVRKLRHSIAERCGPCFSARNKLNTFERFLAGVQNPNPNLSHCLWDARVQAWGRNKAKTSLEIPRILAYGFVLFFFFLTTFSLLFCHFLTFVRWRTVWFLLAFLFC